MAYADLYFTMVCWLVRADPNRLMIQAFLVEITQEPNTDNMRLQGQGQLVTKAYETFKASSTKGTLRKAQLSEKKLNHFAACRCVVEEGTGYKLQQKFAGIKSLSDTFQRFADLVLPMY